MNMTMMDEPDELLDLVDRDDQKIGTVRRAAVMQLFDGKTGYVRAAGVFIVNDTGKIWIPRRAPHKKIVPNGLDFSAGEHVGAGESYRAAAVRGLKEELDLELHTADLEYVGMVPPRPEMPYFEAIFITQVNQITNYNVDDFVSYEWLDPVALRKRLLGGETAKKGLLPALDLLLSYNKTRKEQLWTPGNTKKK